MVLSNKKVNYKIIRIKELKINNTTLTIASKKRVELDGFFLKKLILFYQTLKCFRKNGELKTQACKAEAIVMNFLERIS